MRTYTNMRFRKNALGLLCALLISSGSAQDTSSSPYPNALDSSRTQIFLLPGFGLGRATFRDQATSPLFYTGEALIGSLAFAFEALRWELQIVGDVALARLLSETPESNFFQSQTSAELFHGNFEAIYLRRVKPGAYAKMDYKLGGGLQVSTNARNTPALLNNSLGLEGFAHLLLAAKATRDISRKETTSWKIWFMRLKFKPVQQRISFQIQGGMVNANYRPGYAFSNLPEIDGRPGGLGWQLNDHQLSFNGWRIGTRLAYTRFSKRGNGHRLSYHWDALHAPGQFEPFDMAIHRLQYTLIFNLR